MGIFMSRRWLRGISIGAAIGALAGSGVLLWTPLDAPTARVAAQAPSGIAWMTNLEQARQVAASQGRPILVHFWNDNCPPCVAVERNVFSRPEVERALSSGFVAVKIKVDDAPEVARWFKIDRWPTDLILTADGKELARTVSPQDPQRYVAMLLQAGASLRPSTAAAAQALNQAGAATVEPARQMANQFTGQVAAAAASAGGAFIPPDAGGGFRPGAYVPEPGPALAPQAGPYGAQPANAFAPPAAPAAAPGSSFASQTNAPGAPAGASLTTGLGRAMFGNASASAPSSPPPSVPPPSPPPPSVSPGAASLGMDGYCTVTLMEQHQWKRGDVRWGAIHRDRTYLFAGPDEQQKFLSNPDRFAPMLSGFDAVLFAQQGKLVPGRRQHGVWFQEQMYLFVDEASLERFRSSPGTFAARAEQAMRAAGQAGSTTR